jgi:hypothetical protein
LERADNAPTSALSDIIAFAPPSLVSVKGEIAPSKKAA